MAEDPVELEYQRPSNGDVFPPVQSFKLDREPKRSPEFAGFLVVVGAILVAFVLILVLCGPLDGRGF